MSSSNIVIQYQTRHKEKMAAILKAASLTEMKEAKKRAVCPACSALQLKMKFVALIEKLPRPVHNQW